VPSRCRVVRSGRAPIGREEDACLVAIDGTTLDVADTVVNDEFFGRSGVSEG